MAFAGTTNPIVAGLAGSRDTQLGDQGNFFTVNNVPGTGIASGAVATFVETTPIMVLFNSSNVNSIYPMYLCTHIITVGTGVATAVNWTFVLDAGNRFSQTGTNLVPVNVNMNSNVLSSAIVTFGAVVATTATGARRIVGNAVVKDTVIEVVHDTAAFNFGGSADIQLAAPTTGILSGFVFFLDSATAVAQKSEINGSAKARFGAFRRI